MTKNTQEEHRFSVWVSGGEVNDYLLTKQEAEDMADEWRSEGYDDVVIEEYKLQEELSAET